MHRCSLHSLGTTHARTHLSLPFLPLAGNDRGLRRASAAPEPARRRAGARIHRPPAARGHGRGRARLGRQWGRGEQRGGAGPLCRHRPGVGGPGRARRPRAALRRGGGAEQAGLAGPSPPAPPPPLPFPAAAQAAGPRARSGTLRAAGTARGGQRTPRARTRVENGMPRSRASYG